MANSKRQFMSSTDALYIGTELLPTWLFFVHLLINIILHTPLHTAQHAHLNNPTHPPTPCYQTENILSK